MQQIAIISDHASPLATLGSVDSGGQNLYVASIALELARQGHRVDIFTRKDCPEQPEETAWRPNIRVIHVPAGPSQPVPKEELLPHIGSFSHFIRWYIRRNARQYSVIHANFFMSAMAALPLAQQMDVPLAVTFHALGKVRRMHQCNGDRFPDYRLAVEDEIVRKADCIIAQCPQDRDDLIRLYSADPARVHMVPCGHDPEELKPLDMKAARDELGWSQTAFYILQLSRMVPRKGLDTAIQALARLRHHRGMDARLCIAGGDLSRPDTPEFAEYCRLRSLAARENVDNAVEFAGCIARPQLSQYYSAANVFVTTPWYEPFGITPLEAMACRRPVIGSDTGGIRYTVLDGQTGYLVAPRDPEALAARLAVLAHRPALAARMGIAGSLRVRSLFTWRHVGQELSALFYRLQQARSMPGSMSLQQGLTLQR